MVYISKPEAKSGISRKPGQKSAPASKKPNKQQLQALEKEGRDNTRILQKALGAAPARPAGPPPDAIPAHNPLQRLAASAGAPEEYGHFQHQPAEEAVQYMAAPQPPQQQQAWSSGIVAQAAAEAPPPAAAGPHNYMQRNCQRLGGQGVASLLSDASATQQPGPVKAGASGGFMSSLAALKPGLTDDQKAKAAAQREQLKRDLEEQMRAKRDAEARRKQQLAEQEEREEAALRAYYARQAAEAAAEAGGAAGSSGGKAARGDGAEAAHPAAAAAAAGAGSSGVVVMAPAGKKPGGGSLDGAPAQQAARRAAVVHSAEQPAARRLSAGMELPQQPMLAAPGPAGPPMPGQALAPAPVQLPPAAYSPFLHPLMLGQLGQLPAYTNPFVLPAMLPTPPAPAPSSDNTASQTLATLLKELQAEQQRLRQQFEQQSDTVHRLQSDILLAQRERDAAQQQLQRVHSLLANSSAAPHAPASLEPSGDPGFNLDTLAITTVLPAGYIPSRLSTPAGARGQQQWQSGSTSAATAGLPGKPAARMAGQQRAGGSRVAGASTGTKLPRPGGAAAAGKSTGKGSAVRGQPGKSSRGWM